METQNFEPVISLEIHIQFVTRATLCDPEQQQASCDRNRTDIR